jgi:chromate transporter
VPPRRTERLATVARSGGAWGRSGSAARRPTSCLRQLCVDRRGRIAADEFEDAIAACNLLPGPSSTQLAIFCAGRVGGWPGGARRRRGLHHPRPGGHHRARGALPVVVGVGGGFLEGAGPAAIDAIAGSSVLLAGEPREGWQYLVLAGAAAAPLPARRGIVAVLPAAAVAGEAALVAGAHLPG